MIAVSVIWNVELIPKLTPKLHYLLISFVPYFAYCIGVLCSCPCGGNTNFEKLWKNEPKKTATHTKWIYHFCRLKMQLSFALLKFVVHSIPSTWNKAFWLTALSLDIYIWFEFSTCIPTIRIASCLNIAFLPVESSRYISKMLNWSQPTTMPFPSETIYIRIVAHKYWIQTSSLRYA